MNWNCSIDLIPAQKQHGIQITLRSSSLSPVSAFKPVEKRPCSPDKSDTASRVSKISHTPSIIRTLQSVDNIDDVIREAKKRGGLITGESLSKVVSTCISIPKKKWSLLVKRFILSLTTPVQHV
eukprot:TRINITY_DN2542_c0_g2_i1.p2 TRINITY_DN2542_c0_g2~~TRINITY_DN2542_c0_g2_i1.p2  ORF type:complete len:124 (-),score=17.93 TRINITY_DN2542_c0_g2_i1:564-935(-)